MDNVDTFVDNVDNFVDNLFSKLSFQSYPHILLLINLWKRIFFAVQFIKTHDDNR